MRLNEAFTGARQRPSEEMGSTIMALPSVQFLRQQIRDNPESEILRQAQNPKNKFRIRLANKPGIRHEASLLLNTQYVRSGYGAQELREAEHRMTIVAYDGPDAIGTLSIGLDSSAGLLSDELYRNEIDELRAGGSKLCEFIKFAVIKRPSLSARTLAALFHSAFVFAHRRHRCDEVVIEVNPQHVRFYKRALGFEQIGAERSNRRVNAPAVLLHAKFAYIAAQINKFGGKSGNCKTEKSFYPYFFSQEEEQGILHHLEKI